VVPLREACIGEFFEWVVLSSLPDPIYYIGDDFGISRKEDKNYLLGSLTGDSLP